MIATARTLTKLEELVQNTKSELRENLRILQLDVTEGEVSLKAKANEAAAIWGQIDVLVNNAGQSLILFSYEYLQGLTLDYDVSGLGFPGILEEGGYAFLLILTVSVKLMKSDSSSALLRRQFETNVFGLMDMTNAVLPHLRASKSATLVMIGSRSAWKTELIVRLSRNHQN